MCLISGDRSISLIAAGRKKFLYPGRQRQSSSTVTRGGEPAAAATSRLSGARQTTFETGGPACVLVYTNTLEKQQHAGV